MSHELTSKNISTWPTKNEAGEWVSSDQVKSEDEEDAWVDPRAVHPERSTWPGYNNLGNLVSEVLPQDYSPIFSPLPPTTEGFWGEHVKQPRSPRLLRKLGMGAIRLAHDMPILLNEGLRRSVAAPFIVADRASKSMLTTVDAAAGSLIGLSDGSKFRQYTQKGIENRTQHGDYIEQAIANHSQRTSKRLSSKNSHEWNNRFYALAQEELAKARNANAAGDHTGTKRHMAKAEEHRQLHESRTGK